MRRYTAALREELRQHNALTSAISLLLGQVRKRGLRRALSRPTDKTALPVWRNERGFKLQLGDEVRAVMAAAPIPAAGGGLSEG